MHFHVVFVASFWCVLQSCLAKRPSFLWYSSISHARLWVSWAIESCDLKPPQRGLETHDILCYAIWFIQYCMCELQHEWNILADIAGMFDTITLLMLNTLQSWICSYGFMNMTTVSLGNWWRGTVNVWNKEWREL